MRDNAAAPWRSVGWWIGVAIFVLATAAVIQAFSFDEFGRVFPIFIGTPIALLALLHTVLGLVRGTAPADTADEAPAERTDADVLKDRFIYFGWVGLLLALFFLCGALVGIPLFVVAFMLAHRERWWLALILAAGLAVFIYIILDQTMHVSFPRPLLWTWFH